MPEDHRGDRSYCIQEYYKPAGFASLEQAVHFKLAKILHTHNFNVEQLNILGTRVCALKFKRQRQYYGVGDRLESAGIPVEPHVTMQGKKANIMILMPNMRELWEILGPQQSVAESPTTWFTTPSPAPESPEATR